MSYFQPADALFFLFLQLINEFICILFSFNLHYFVFAHKPCLLFGWGLCNIYPLFFVKLTYMLIFTALYCISDTGNYLTIVI